MALLTSGSLGSLEGIGKRTKVSDSFSLSCGQASATSVPELLLQRQGEEVRTMDQEDIAWCAIFASVESRHAVDSDVLNFVALHESMDLITGCKVKRAAGDDRSNQVFKDMVVVDTEVYSRFKSGT